MSIRVVNGMIEMQGKHVDLPGVVTRFQEHRNGYLVMVDPRSTNDNVFYIDTKGDIIWQLSTEGNVMQYYCDIDTYGDLIFVRTLDRKFMMVDSQSGKVQKLTEIVARILTLPEHEYESQQTVVS